MVEKIPFVPENLDLRSISSNQDLNNRELCRRHFHQYISYKPSSTLFGAIWSSFVFQFHVFDEFYHFTTYVAWLCHYEWILVDVL